MSHLPLAATEDIPSFCLKTMGTKVAQEPSAACSRIVGKPEVRRIGEFENRLLECAHSQQFSLKLLKALVQGFRNPAEKFENRLLGPTNNFVHSFQELVGISILHF